MALQVGDKTKEGNILVLGGWIADLFMLPDDSFKVEDRVLDTEEQAMRAYNEVNGTETGLDHISKYFRPSYAKKRHWKLIEVPSAHTENVKYRVQYNNLGEFKCNCTGFKFRNKCWHTDAVKDLL